MTDSADNRPAGEHRPRRAPGPGPRSRPGSVLAAGFAAALVLATASVLAAPTEPARAEGLSTFDSCQAVDNWFSDGLRDQVGAYGLGNPGRDAIAFGVPAVAGAETADAASTERAVGNTSTGTNVQEAGYDEADVIKTANDLLVTTSGSRLEVLNVTGIAPRIVGSLELPERRSQPGSYPGGYQNQSALLLQGDRVLVLTSQGTAPAAPAESLLYPAASPATASTVIRVVDLADPAAPVSVGSSEITGSLIDARLHDGSARVVTSSINLPGFSYPSWPDATTREPTAEEIAAAEARAKTENLRRFDAMTGADFLPQLITRDSAGTVTGSAPAIACQGLAHPADFSGPSLLTVSTVLPEAATPGADPVHSRTVVTADGGTVYAGENRLYVATTRWMNADPWDASTTIHAFDTSAPESTRYLASGTVGGDVLGRWAFDVHDGVLRVASTRTTDFPAGPTDPATSGVAVPRTDNAVTTLVERDGRLVVAGSLVGLARGERIQSVRWFEDTAYLVTFLRTDPLFVIDLSDQSEPRVRGELKVPGFSQYLHPIGDHRLLGVGTSGDQNGATDGVQVATFDVADPQHPRALDRVELSHKQSQVQFNSLAFTYLPDSAEAILPVQDLNDGSAAVVSVRAGSDGTLSTGPSLATGACTPQRTVPVAGQRLAVLCEGWGDTLARQVILTGHDLTEQGRVSL